MPSKRSKSKERERKRKYRQQISDEKKSSENSKSKEKERKRRYRQQMSDEERNIEKEKLKERMRNLRERTKPQGEKRVTMTSTLWAPGQLYGESKLYLRNNKMAKKRLQEKREKFTSEERENENEEAKIRMRELRDKQTDEARKEENQKAKIRMKKVREKYTDDKRKIMKDRNKERMRKKRMENILFEDSDEYSDDSSEISSEGSDENLENPPDIIKQLNEEHRKNQEMETRAVDEVENCICDYDINCPYCKAQQEAEKSLYPIISKEESARYEKEELEDYKRIIKNKRKEKRMALLEKAKQPMPPLPVRELSEYEKIRENIISQRRKEWELYEKEWENQWVTSKEKK